MEIRKWQRGRVQVLDLSGRMTAGEAPKLEQQLAGLREPAEPDEPRYVVLDVTALDNLPSAVVGALLETIRALEAAGGRLVLAGANEAVCLVLDRLGVSELVGRYDSLDEALAALSAGNSAPDA